MLGTRGQDGPRARPRRRCLSTCETSTDKHGSVRGAYFKFKGNVTKSFLCVQCKSKGATRAARAQCAHPVLSAKRRHQIHDVDHRDGGAEHLWQQRQFPHAVSIMIGNGRTAPTCQSGLAGRMGEWCTRRAHSMDCSHGTGPGGPHEEPATNFSWQSRTLKGGEPPSSPVHHRFITYVFAKA